MGLVIYINGAENGYVITKNRHDLVGIPEEIRVASDTADLFKQLALILDYDWTADAKRGGEVT